MSGKRWASETKRQSKHLPHTRKTISEKPMRLKSIEVSEKGDRPWTFGNVNFKMVNLFVGATGSGKSRLFNAIFNIARFAVGNLPLSPSDWKMSVGDDEIEITWHFATIGVLDRFTGAKPRIAKEQITVRDNKGAKITIVDRSEDKFLFDGEPLPKFSPDQSAVTLLREEDSIKPLYDTLRRIIRRSFPEATQSQLASYSGIPKRFSDTLKPGHLPVDAVAELGLSAKLYALRECSRVKYDNLIASYRSLFPFIENCQIADASKFGLEVPAIGQVPVFAINERGVHAPIPLHELSSGMIKVLLIMADIVALQKGWTYLIDEYENSLGVNAINFLPAFLEDNAGNIQFIITTHHPYLINSMPVTNWCLFKRSGSHVTVVPGEELAQKFGKSKQQAFLQLINDESFS
jgi:predicted ATPase